MCALSSQSYSGNRAPARRIGHAANEQIYYSSRVPCTYLCARLLETLD